MIEQALFSTGSNQREFIIGTNVKKNGWPPQAAILEFEEKKS